MEQHQGPWVIGSWVTVGLPVRQRVNRSKQLHQLNNGLVTVVDDGRENGQSNPRRVSASGFSKASEDAAISLNCAVWEKTQCRTQTPKPPIGRPLRLRCVIATCHLVGVTFDLTCRSAARTSWQCRDPSSCRLLIGQ